MGICEKCHNKFPVGKSSMTLETAVLEHLSPEMNQALLALSQVGEHAEEMELIAFGYRPVKDSASLMFQDYDNMRVIYEVTKNHRYNFYGMHRI